MSAGHDSQMGPQPSGRSNAHRFNLGQVVATPAAMALLEKYRVNPLMLLGRHLSGDWGDLCDEDQLRNDVSLVDGGRIFSSYLITPSERGDDGALTIWVITEAVGHEGKRSSTCLLTPDEY